MRNAQIVFAIFLLLMISPGCSDDSSGKGGGNSDARVDTAIEGVVDSYEDYYRGICVCMEKLGGDDVQTCMSPHLPINGDLTDCQREAAKCEIDNYVEAMNCRRDVNNDFTACINSCPSGAELEDCNDAHAAGLQRCDGLFNAELINGFELCSNGRTPRCASSTPTPGGGQCISQQQFLDNLTDNVWSVYYMAGSDGIFRCKHGEYCMHEQYIFDKDGSYTYAYSVFDYGSTSSSPMVKIVCSLGTWVLDCDELILTDCQGTEVNKIALTTEGFLLGAREFTVGQSYIPTGPGGACQTRRCQ